LNELLAEGLHNRIAVEPAAKGNYAAAAKQDDDNDTDDETCVAFLGSFGWGNRHFVHDFFSFSL
jgi:hypothetical protein